MNALQKSQFVVACLAEVGIAATAEPIGDEWSVRHAKPLSELDVDALYRAYELMKLTAGETPGCRTCWDELNARACSAGSCGAA